MTKANQLIPLNLLYQKFVDETSKGKRLQKNGKSVSQSTIKSYKVLLKNIKLFESNSKEIFLINVNYKYSKRLFELEKRKYNKFYIKFTDFLYQKGCTDNYVGILIKYLRSFFNYLNENKGYNTGLFYKEFYIRKEEIPVIVLNMMQLKLLISNREFESKLPKHLMTTKDLFVLGCTVGLRFSDLISLKKKNLIIDENKYYIVSRSLKTSTDTRIKLPEYAKDILIKYKTNPKNLLPTISLNQFNKNLKDIGLIAGWTYEVGKERCRRGVRREIKNNGKTYRFCDLISSHIMRRTAITTLLIHGMPEPLVRKISGHAPGSKEFYKYVQYSESFLDKETDRVFDLVMSIY
jgi:integrase